MKKSIDLEKLIEKAPKYEVTYTEGLNDVQVNERIDNNLTNKRRKTVTKSYFEIIFKNIFTVLNVLLIMVASFMLYFGLIDRLFFVIILSLNIGISLFQDIKARKLVGKLSLLSSPQVEVVRNSNKFKINFNNVVLGDIIILKAGNTIPCDSIVLNGSIHVNESLLSGETEDVLKEQGAQIFSESVVTAGLAYARVVKVGSANYASKLQEKAREFSRPKSEILTSLTYIIRGISLTAILVGVAEIATKITQYGLSGQIGYAEQKDMADTVGSSVVGMIPIGMYLMTSITLSIGVIILSKHRILVRELYSIEMLARVNAICADKTGTLTDGSMKVKEIIPINNADINHIENTVSSLLYLTKDDNLTARALKEKYPVIPVQVDFAAIPFSSDKKLSAASYLGHTYVIGAYGFVPAINNQEVANEIHKYELGGYRVLVFAESNSIIEDNKIPNNLVIIGLIILSENIKPDAKENIAWFKQYDVSVRIISGDSIVSLQNIAKQVGVDHADKAVSLEGMNDEETKKAARENYIFGRVTPEQKKIIVNELQEMGYTVAMVGDGVNDLLALKSADCSIAMASGSDAAKAASHLVSIDSNFSALPKVVEEGRRAINNLQRVCSVFLVKTIFAIFMSILFLILSWFKVGEGYPYFTNHLMAWEVITIGVAPFFVALEPNRDRIKGGFIKNIVREAIPGATIQIIVTLPLILASYIKPDLFPFDGVIALSVILMSCMSYVVLFHVCHPLNKYRSRVLLGTFVGIGLFFVMDLLIYYFGGGGGGKLGILKIDYSMITLSCLVLGAVLVLIGIPLYFLFCYLFRLLFRKMDYEQKNSN